MENSSRKSVNKIKARRLAGAICDKCRSPDYKLDDKHEGTKLQFICNSCGNIWQSGITGGIYKENL